MRQQSLFQVGAYFVGPGMVTGAFSLRFMPEAYDVQAIHIMCKGMFTNTPQAGPVSRRRTAGGRVFHRAHDRACGAPDRHRPGRDPPPQPDPEAKLPYNTPTFFTYDSGEFERVMDKCIELADWKGYEKRRKASEKAGKLRGRSVCYYIEFGGIFNDRMDIRFDPGGTVTVFGGTHSHGQGHATVFAQLVHEFLGVPFESIRYVQGDTAQVPFGRGTYGARSAVVGGSALEARRGHDHRQGEADGRRHAGGRRRRHRVRRWSLQSGGHRQGDPAGRSREGLLRADGADDQVRHRAGRLRHPFARTAEPSERLARLRGRDRSGDRRGHGRALHRGRRSRAGA